LYIRIPGWASENPVPGNLYSFINTPDKKPVFKINGKEVTPAIENGYAVLSKTWKTGDWVDISFPFEIRKIRASENIEDNRGKMALQLGPLVYCAEFADYENPDISNLVLNENAVLSAEYEPGLLGGVNVISGNAEEIKVADNNGPMETWPRQFKAIPYYAWSHRGKGQMAVWIPTSGDSK
jgi:DUF1680 family protein